MEVMVGPGFHPGEEEAGGSRKGIGFRSSGKSLEEEESESSSSIGGPEDSDEEEEEEHVAVSSGGGMASLDDALPVKRGLSNHYSGKSKSFANLSEVNSVKELKKEEKPFNKRRRVLMANKWYMVKKANSFYSWQNPKSMPLLALNEEEDEDRQQVLLLPSPSSSSSSSSESLKPRMKSQSCFFSLPDLQEEDQL